MSLGKINSCQHSFHYKCIYRWSRISNNCPTCRMAFTEICHLKANRILKKIKLHEDSHSTEEDVSNSDIEEWHAICPVCESSEEDFMMVCEGEFGCSNVCHSYCIGVDPTPQHWVCRDCEAQESESLAEEDSSSVEETSEIHSELESDPDAEYEPLADSPELRRSTRKRPRRIHYISSEDEEEVLENIEEDSDSVEDFSDDDQEKVLNFHKQPLRRLRRNTKENQKKRKKNDLPLKRTQSENDFDLAGLKKFVNDLVESETTKETQHLRGFKINLPRVQRVLKKEILNSQRLNNYHDPRTVQKMKTVIKNHIAGLI